MNSIGLYSYNLLIITFFTTPVIFFYKISSIRKVFNLTFVFTMILSLYIYGNYSINKNNFYLSTINEKIYVKIISPNFNLEYGLGAKEIEDRFKKLIRYSDPDKDKKLYLFGQKGSLADIAMMKF